MEANRRPPKTKHLHRSADAVYYDPNPPLDVTPPALVTPARGAGARVEPAELRFTGRLSLLGRETQVDLTLYVSRAQVVDFLLDLLQRPDDQTDAGLAIEWTETGPELFELQLGQPPAERPITLDDLDAEPDSGRRWLMLAERFPDLFGPDINNPADLRRLQKTLGPDPAAGGQASSPKPTRDLKSDLRLLLPQIDQIINAGQANKSEIARILNIPAGGSTTWPYLQKLARILERRHQRGREAA